MWLSYLWLVYSFQSLRIERITGCDSNNKRKSFLIRSLIRKDCFVITQLPAVFLYNDVPLQASYP